MGLRQERFERANAFNAALPRKIDVDQRDLGMHVREARDSALGVRKFAHARKAARFLQPAHEYFTDGYVVLDDGDGDGR